MRAMKFLRNILKSRVKEMQKSIDMLEAKSDYYYYELSELRSKIRYLLSDEKSLINHQTQAQSTCVNLHNKTYVHQNMHMVSTSHKKNVNSCIIHMSI